MTDPENFSPSDDGNHSKSSKKTKLMSLVVVLSLTISALAMVNIKRNHDFNRNLSTVEVLIKQRDFQGARNLLSLAREQKPSNVVVKEKFEEIDKLERSIKSFQNGERFFKAGKLAEAIDSYVQVSEIDSENYRAAIEELNTARAKFAEQTLAKITDLESAKHYDDALSLATAALMRVPANQLLEKAKYRLESAIAKRKLASDKAERQRYIQALRSMRVSKDKYSVVSYYYDKSSPQYVNYNGFFLYIADTGDGYPLLHLKIQYAADDWLFIKSYKFNVDGTVYSIEPNYGEVQQDNGYGGIWEWIDLTDGSVSSSETTFDLQMVKDILRSKSATYRIYGDQYYDDRIINNSQKLALENVLNAYEALRNRVRIS